MVRWWAAFFIAGLLVPWNSEPAPAISAAACAAAAIAALGGIAASRARGKTLGRLQLSMTAVYFTITCSGAVIAWEAGALERGARDLASVETANRALLSSRFERGRPSGSRRMKEEAAAGIRSLALTGVRKGLLESLEGDGLSKRSRGLVAALVLDDRSALDSDLSDAYSYLGITHFLALSGLHLGVIAIPLSKMLSLFIRSGRKRDAALLAVLCLYAAIAGFPPSLLRALFLSAAVIAYRLAGMHSDLLGALIVGSLVLVAIDPPVAFDAGFQLSFAAVCGIALVGIPISRMVESRLSKGFRGAMLKAIVFPALITCSVQFLTMPLVIALFKRSSILSPLVNVVVSLPFTALLYMGVIYVFIPFAPLRAVLAHPINLLCRFLEIVPTAFSRRPHPALYRGDFNPCVYFFGAALVAWAVQRGWRRNLRMLIAGFACVMVSFAVPARPWRTLSLPRSGAAARESTERRVFSGNGSICIVERGCVLFIGDAFSSRQAYRLTRELWGIGVRSIECCVVKPSTLRANHGLFYLMTRVRIEKIVCSPYLFSADSGLRELLEKRGISVRAVSAGDSLEGGEWRLEFLAPAYPPREGKVVSRADAALACRLITVERDAPGARVAPGSAQRMIDPDAVRQPCFRERK